MESRGKDAVGKDAGGTRPQQNHSTSTLTISSDSGALLHDGPIDGLEARHAPGGELGQKVGSLGGRHVDHDELNVRASEDGGGTGTGDTPVVCGRERRLSVELRRRGW